MKRRTVLQAGLVLPLLAGLPSACSYLPGGMYGTLIVLRHADRDGPNLNAQGRARAAALPAALAGVPVDGIFSPDKQRNLDTVAPLAAERGLEVQVIEPTNILVQMFRGRYGQTLVWVGNTTNIEPLWEDELKAFGRPPTEYGDLFIVTLRDSGGMRIDRRHYGV